MSPTHRPRHDDTVCPDPAACRRRYHSSLATGDCCTCCGRVVDEQLVDESGVERALRPKLETGAITNDEAEALRDFAAFLATRPGPRPAAPPSGLDLAQHAIRPKPGDRVRFDGRRTSWLARAATRDGRYLLLTAALFGTVRYTIIDFDQDIRGAMNISGHGLGIFTIRGPDAAIDEAIAMLQGDGDFEGEAGDWEVSHRNNVRLRITDHRPREVPAP